MPEISIDGKAYSLHFSPVTPKNGSRRTFTSTEDVKEAISLYAKKIEENKLSPVDDLP